MQLKIRAVCAKRKKADFCELVSASVCGFVVLTTKNIHSHNRVEVGTAGDGIAQCFV